MASDPAGALEKAASIPRDSLTPRVRNALFIALEREGRLTAASGLAPGTILEPLEDPEFKARVARLVAELKDPASIPAFTAGLGNGSVFYRPLLEFGQAAAPAVLEVVF